MNIGFSTGSIAYGDFRSALYVLNQTESNVIELSALREAELMPLLNDLDNLDLNHFKFISFHAPSKRQNLSEAEFVEQLHRVAQKGWSIIVHPDIIVDFELWRSLGKYLCLENMDKRKPIGRTTKDMEILFEKLPDATFCFDIAHVRQVDPTLMEGFSMIKKLGSRLKQLHISEVNSESKHQPLTFESILAFSTMASLIPNDVPIVLESPVKSDQILREMEKVKLIFNPKMLLNILMPLKDTSVYFHNKVSELNSILA
jgi:hypothetical protein